jgi:hypothetical protein
MELGHRDARQSGLRRLVRSHLGVRSQPREGGQLPVGKCSEQVDDCGAIGGVVGKRIVCDREGLGVDSLASGACGEGLLLIYVIHDGSQ